MKQSPNTETKPRSWHATDHTKHKSHYLNCLSLLSPRTWIGILEALKLTVPGYSTLLSHVCVQWITTVIIPFILLRSMAPIKQMDICDIQCFAGQRSMIKGIPQGFQNSLIGMSAYMNLSPINSWHEVDSTMSLDRSQDEFFVDAAHGLHRMTRRRQYLPKFLQTTIVSTIKHLNHSLLHVTTICALLLSPQGLHTVHQTALLLQRTWLRLTAFRALRLNADEDAIAVLQEGIEEARAFRTRYYDLYLPFSTSTFKNSASTERPGRSASAEAMKILLLFPGAFVDHTAYARLASKLSQEGNIIVGVLSMEPLRFAIPNLGASFSDLRRIMKDILTKLHDIDESACPSSTSKLACRGYEWCIAGHSLGGYAALRLAPKMAKAICTLQPSFSTHQRKLKAITLASGDNTKFMNTVPHWKEYRTKFGAADIHIEYLCLFASNDRLCTFETQKDWENFTSHLPPPPQSKIVTIAGATHNNFASYPSNPLFDGVPGISRNRQHDIVCHKTISFLHK